MVFMKGYIIPSLIWLIIVYVMFMFLNKDA